jgi:hypothetical protein
VKEIEPIEIADETTLQQMTFSDAMRESSCLMVRGEL